MVPDPVVPQESAHVPSPAASEFIDPEVDREGDAPSGVREGLPPSFRPRRDRHYVEHVTGDAPLRTVREIAIADVEQPVDEPLDVQDLERSIREVGIVEPLIVARNGRRYRVIAGRKRLRAATRAGLQTVPCVVYDADDETISRMREAVRQRTGSPVPAETLPPGSVREPTLAPALREIGAALTFLNDLLPAITSAAEDRFRSSVLTDLARVELMRVRSAALAAEVLSSSTVLRRTEVRLEGLLGRALTGGAAEARLRGVSLETTIADPGYGIALDTRLVTAALSAIVHGLLAIPPSGRAVLRMEARGTVIRPALIVDVTRSDVPLDPGSPERFFDPAWVDHPAGRSGGVMFAGALAIARLHGGRVGVGAQSPRGCTVTFVVPRP